MCIDFELIVLHCVWSKCDQFQLRMDQRNYCISWLQSCMCKSSTISYCYLLLSVCCYLIIVPLLSLPNLYYLNSYQQNYRIRKVHVYCVNLHGPALVTNGPMKLCISWLQSCGRVLNQVLSIAKQQGLLRTIGQPHMDLTTTPKHKYLCYLQYISLYLIGILI